MSSTRRRARLIAALIVALLSAVAIYQERTPTAQVVRTLPEVTVAGSYDVIVIGSEPEGVAAAVAAAQEGASTLLVSHDDKVGGLFVLGQMNSLDLRTQPTLMQRGLFEDWWQRTGRHMSFDVGRAEQAFINMLVEAGVSVKLSEQTIRPVFEGERLSGVYLDEGLVTARQLIDATAEADFAAAAGATYSMGFAGLGLDERMVDTLVFRIDDVDWAALRRGISERGRDYAISDERVAWGHFGGEPAAYQGLEPGIRLRGLNLGRQDDGSVLVNALLIYGIDPFDPASVQDGFDRARREAPRIISYLSARVPGFEDATFGGVADALYIRETRHIDAECTLTANDTLNNIVTDQDVVAGGYPLDVQVLTPFDNGYVFGTPDIYGARLCVAVPKGVGPLWVVGKAAGYDALAASSARVVPFGMALGEAVGVAATRALRLGLSPAEFASNDLEIAALRRRLEARGAYLAPVRPRDPVGPFEHPHFDAYRLLLGRGLALGGYNNDPNLDDRVSSLGYVYLLSNVGQRFFGNDTLGPVLQGRYPTADIPLTPRRALLITRDAACELGRCLDTTWQALIEAGLAPSDFPPDDDLDRGEAYALAARLIQFYDDPRADTAP
ncbi:MAG: FAD-dependent oxidoreductase [Trueperaceae bacterium]|nr:FAD-dependent oxidoreductase [Trueperaceae bacterium]